MTNIRTYCPGFNLYTVTDNNGDTHTIEGDYPGSAETRLFFRSEGKLNAVAVVLIGKNPAAIAWKAADKADQLSLPLNTR